MSCACGRTSASPTELTTDAKIIPTLVSRRLGEGEPLDAAFLSTVARFEGSVAIAVSSAEAPDDLHLALRGSGQSLYIGLAEDAFVVASEPYGLVEETSTYLRMDGEATRGQVVALSRSGRRHARRCAAGGLRRHADLPVEFPELRTAEITTRDIDRGGFPHFLLKEISEAPKSFRKTLRGKVRSDERSGRLVVSLGDDALPPAVRARLASGAITTDPGDRPGHRRGRRPERGRRHRRCPRPLPGRGHRPAGHRAVRLRAGRRHERHPRRRRQPVGHHHRHQPHRRSGPSPGRAGDLHRQPPQQRPRRAFRRGAVHLRRARRRDERGRRPRRSTPRWRPASCSPWPSPTCWAVATGGAPTTCSAPCACCPTAMEEVLGRRETIADAAAAVGAEPALLGGGRQRTQPHRRLGDPDQAVGAVLQVDRL